MGIQFAFSNYIFDVNTGLSFDGQPVHLPPKEKGLLHLLLEARGQIVRKSELVAKIWEVNQASDESISRTVYRLRVAMSSSGGIEVVETVYNSGFRITVPIRVSNMDESSSLNAMTQSKRPNAVAALISAREFLARRSIEDIDAAASAVRHAISIDPGFSAAWSTLAEIRVFQAMRSLRPPREVGWLANEAVQSALEIDPKSASALSIRGWIRSMIEQDYDRGLEDLDQAYKYDPDYWGVNLLRGWILQATKRHQDAVVMMRRAIELNPVGHSVNSILALYLLFSGEVDESLSVSRELARRFPTIDNAQSIACIVTSVHGLHEESIAFGRKAMRLAPHTPIIHAPLAYALAHAGRHDEARGILNTMEMSNLPKPSAALAPVYLVLGEKETAIELIKDAHERGVPQFAWTRDDPRLSSLKGEPSVERLWARIGLSANFSPSQTFPAPLVDGFLNLQGR